MVRLGLLSDGTSLQETMSAFWKLCVIVRERFTTIRSIDAKFELFFIHDNSAYMKINGKDGIS